MNSSCSKYHVWFYIASPWSAFFFLSTESITQRLRLDLMLDLICFSCLYTNKILFRISLHCCSFDEFLMDMKQSKRKNIRQERKKVHLLFFLRSHHTHSNEFELCLFTLACKAYDCWSECYRSTQCLHHCMMRHASLLLRTWKFSYWSYIWILCCDLKGSTYTIVSEVTLHGLNLGHGYLLHISWQRMKLFFP